MKKKIFTLLMALVAISVSAQVPSGQNVKRSKAAARMNAPALGSGTLIFSDNFDAGTLDNWVTIDADGDRYTWVHSSTPEAYLQSSANLSGAGHNSSEGFALSGSYTNTGSGSLNPDNYLVTKEKVTLGGTLIFWSCAQDVSYPYEHFGVAVSTTSNSDASTFTMLQEWTMTAAPGMKLSPGKNVLRGPLRAQGSWYQYTVDLSDYAGQEGYVAFRHFGCSNQFILNIDDVEIYDGTPGGVTPPSGIPIDEDHFPDVNFRAYISSADSGIDDDQNGYLSDEEIANVTNIDVAVREIADLTGIQYFTNLMLLNCSYNMLTALDLSALSHLEFIDCSYNQIATLDLSQNTALITVWCHGNQLTSLNVEGLTTLRELRCYWNMLKGDAMAQLVDALNDVEVGKEFRVYNELSIDRAASDRTASYPYPMAKRAPRKSRLYEEGNEITAEQVRQAFTKYWVPCCFNGRYWTEYFGKIDATVEESLTLKDGMTISENFGMFEQVKPLYFIELLLAMEILTISEGSSEDLFIIEKDGKKLFTLTWNSANKVYVVTLADGVTSADDFTVEISEELRNEVLDYSYKEGIEPLPLTVKRLAPRRSEPEFPLLDIMQWFASWKSITIHFANEADGIAIDETNFPDQNFREYLLAQSYGEDAVLTEEEIAAITSLNLYGRNIADLTGIEHFTALTWLDCSMNQLTKLDLSKNTALTEVRFYSNQINQTAMQSLLESLPKGNGYILYVFDEDNADEGNVITEEQVAFAADKGWNVKNNFGDPYAGTTGIRSLTTTVSQGQGTWYTLDGRRLDSEPTQKGIYIYNGKKVRK